MSLSFVRRASVPGIAGADQHLRRCSHRDSPTRAVDRGWMMDLRKSFAVCHSTLFPFFASPTAIAEPAEQSLAHNNRIERARD